MTIEQAAFDAGRDDLADYHSETMADVERAIGLVADDDKGTADPYVSGASVIRIRFLVDGLHPYVPLWMRRRVDVPFVDVPFGFSCLFATWKAELVSVKPDWPNATATATYRITIDQEVTV